MQPASPASVRPGRVPRDRPGRVGGRRDQNRLARATAIGDGAVACFLRLGLDAVTIDDVVRAAGIAKGSFYRYFQSKEDLVAAIFEPLASLVGTALDRATAAVEAAEDAQALEEAYRGLVAELAPVLVGRTSVVRVFLQERHGPPTPARAPIAALDRAVHAAALRVAVAGRSHGLVRDLEPEVSALVALGAVHELAWRVLADERHLNPVAAANAVIDVVLHGVGAPGPHHVEPREAPR